jgi:hypothetical protein
VSLTSLVEVEAKTKKDREIKPVSAEEIKALKQKVIDESNYISLDNCSSGFKLDDFKIVKLIGKGSFGKVRKYLIFIH